MKSLLTLTRPLHEPSATLFLALLIAGDIAFIVLHLLNLDQGVRNPFSLTVDRGHPEFFQYTKLFWICLLLGRTCFVLEAKQFIAWVLLFAYFLMDDAFGIHEVGGVLLTADLDSEPHFGLRMQDYGELAVTAIAGLTLSASLVYAYFSGSRAFRMISIELAALTGLLVVFGVGVDFVHAALESGWRVEQVLRILEDGGEMVAVSLILWYVFLMVVRGRNFTGLVDRKVR